MAIRDQTIGEFLDQLAERVPAPGGGAAAALLAAQGAALLGMVARYTTGEKYAEHQVTISRIIAEVDELRNIALRLADADADAFLAVDRRLPAAQVHGRGAGRPGRGRRRSPSPTRPGPRPRSSAWPGWWSTSRRRWS